METFSAAQLVDKAAETMIKYNTQLHYPDIVLTSSCPILLMLSVRLGSQQQASILKVNGLTRPGTELPNLQQE